MIREITGQVDLRGFSDASTELVLSALSRGWIGRVSNKGHAILYWPNGGSVSVSRNLDGKRRGDNAKADIRRIERYYPVYDDRKIERTEASVQKPITKNWVRASGKVSGVVLETTNTTSSPSYSCAICHKVIDTPQGTARHASSMHGAETVRSHEDAATAAAWSEKYAVPGDDGNEYSFDTSTNPFKSESDAAEPAPEPEPELEPEPVADALLGVVTPDESTPDMTALGMIHQIKKLLMPEIAAEIVKLREENDRLREHISTVQELLGDIVK